MDTLLDEDLRLYTDLEDVVQCEVKNEDGVACPNRAAWKCICVVCGKTVMMCDMCRNHFLSGLQSGLLLICTDCDTLSGWIPFFLGSRWEMKVRWEPYEQHRPRS